MKNLLLLLFVCVVAVVPPAYAQQQTASISGFVTDETNGETLLLANVFIVGTTTGAATNNAGYYTLTGLEPGSFVLACTYLGFQEQRFEIMLEPGQELRLDIALVPEGVTFDEVIVTAAADLQEENKRIGVSQLSVQTVKQLPTVLEPDVFRSLQLLPGVKAASDFSSGLYIRGGSPDQTLILLDRTTVYNPSHFFGFFSTFNPDAIKDVRLFKGGYPAEYGGRLGAVVDVYNKDGNRRKTAGTASIGLLASRAMVEGPYSKGSWMVAVRRSTIDPLLNALQDTDGIPEKYYFFDVNTKVNFDASDNDKFSVAAYAGQDKLNVSPLDDFDISVLYGNRTISANWTHIFSNSLFSNFTVTASRYFSEPEFDLQGTGFERTNTVTDVSARGDFEYIPNEEHALSLGFWAGNFVMKLEDIFDGSISLDERIQSVYASAYVQETYTPNPLWEIRGGLRTSFFNEGDFLRLEPRLSLEHRPVANVRFQLGYGRYYQYLTLITGELFSAFDIWLTTDDGIRPAYGDQFVGGVKTNLGDGYNLDVELYYRTMEDLFILDPFLPDGAGVPYEDLFIVGNGDAWGTEVFLEKTRGRLNGFIGYTLGQTRRRFPNINDFEYYTPKYDRTHDLNMVVNYDLSRKWRATAVFSYGTGQAYTEPNGQYSLLDDPFGEASRNGLVSEFNGNRLDPYHRLDLGFSRFGKFFKLESELQLQVINVYGRSNDWFVFYEFEEDGAADRIVAERNTVPQIPIPLPNVSFTVRF